MESWARRCRQERDSRDSPASRSGRWWTIHFDRTGQEQIRVKVREALQGAHRKVLGLFLLEPDHPVPVVLYADRTFHDITRAPIWAGGLYDGTIRLPVHNLQEGPELQRMVTHEWTHAVLHQATAGRCPLWLHEGLAEFTSREHPPDTLSIPLKDLLNGFPRAPVPAVMAAYRTAHKAAADLIRRWGHTSMRRFLRALGEGVPVADAFESTFPLSFSTFLSQEAPR